MVSGIVGKAFGLERSKLQRLGFPDLIPNIYQPPLYAQSPAATISLKLEEAFAMRCSK